MTRSGGAEQRRHGVAAAMHRSQRWVLGAALAALTLLAWLYLVVLDSAMEAMRGAASSDSAVMWLMPMGHWGAAEFALGFAMWVVMMIAMMVPSAAPMLFAFHSVSRSRAGGPPAGTGVAAFVSGYAVVWAAFSLLATAAQALLHEAAMLSDLMTSSSRTLDGVLLLCAGIYQFTPMKRVCLSRCRTPMGFVLTEWRDGIRGASIMGMRHGAYCVGCCWGLMALLFVGGVMNLVWVAALSIAVLLEKALPFGPMFAKLSGLVMLACASWLLFGV